VIIFKATLKNGSSYIGPIQGNGGYLGAGSAYAGPDVEAQMAKEEIASVVKAIEEGLPLPDIYYPIPGHVSMSVEALAKKTKSSPDEERVSVPVKGTHFEIIAAFSQRKEDEE